MSRSSRRRRAPAAWDPLTLVAFTAGVLALLTLLFFSSANEEEPEPGPAAAGDRVVSVEDVGGLVTALPSRGEPSLSKADLNERCGSIASHAGSNEGLKKSAQDASGREGS